MRYFNREKPLEKIGSDIPANIYGSLAEIKRSIQIDAISHFS